MMGKGWFDGSNSADGGPRRTFRRLLMTAYVWLFHIFPNVSFRKVLRGWQKLSAKKKSPLKWFAIAFVALRVRCSIMRSGVTKIPALLAVKRQSSDHAASNFSQGSMRHSFFKSSNLVKMTGGALLEYLE